MGAVEVGAGAVRLAVVAGSLAAVVGCVPMLASRWRRVGMAALAVAAGALGVAVVVLGLAFWSADFSLAYVADHTRRDAGAATRISGLWGGMGGSLLFFAFGTAVAAGAGSQRAPHALRGVVAAVGGAITATLAAFVVALSDPFARLDVPAADGAGLTPILEHPAMLYHPPLIYAGLTSLTAVFALTVATLWRGHLDVGWLDQVRRWLLVPWTLLAVGMLTGAHWAYVELGWGGYWAWDPVENTALLPWLAVTAAVHGLQVSGRDGRRAVGPRAVAGLVGAAFLLAVLGALLTRSGATSSVHAFAEARSIGRAFAMMLLVAAAGFGTVLTRHRRARAPGPPRGPWTWEPTRHGALRLQLVLVVSGLVVVLAGSVWPLVADLRGGPSLAVDGTYFAAFCGPLAVATLLVMAVGPALGRHPARSVAATAVTGAASGVVLAALGGWSGWFPAATAAAGGAAVAGAARALVVDRGTGRRVGAHLAHLGFAVFLLGVAGTATGTTETVLLEEGGSTVVHGRTVTNGGVAVVEGAVADVTAVEATVDVDGHTLRPQLVAHSRRNRLLAESALRSTWTEDVQLMLRDARDDGTIVVEVGVHPLQQLVWWGALVLVAGGVVALAGRGVTLPGRARPPGRHLPVDRAGDAATPAALPASRSGAAPAGAARPAAPASSARSAEV